MFNNSNKSERASDASATTPAFCHGQGPDYDSDSSQRVREREREGVSAQERDLQGERVAGAKDKRPDSKTYVRDIRADANSQRGCCCCC